MHSKRPAFSAVQSLKSTTSLKVAFVKRRPSARRRPIERRLQKRGVKTFLHSEELVLKKKRKLVDLGLSFLSLFFSWVH